MNYFSNEYSDLDPEMVMAILSIFDTVSDEKEAPDRMISMRDKALKKLKRTFDHDD